MYDQKLADTQKQLATVTAERDKEKAYAKRLVESFARVFPAIPEWTPLDDLLGILTQIDNIGTGFIQQRDQAIQERDGLAAKLTHVARESDSWRDQYLAAADERDGLAAALAENLNSAYGRRPDLAQLATISAAILAARDARIKRETLEAAWNEITRNWDTEPATVVRNMMEGRDPGDEEVK